MADHAYRSWRAALYISNSYPYTIHDDAALQANLHSFTYSVDGELDEIILGERVKDDF